MKTRSALLKRVPRLGCSAYGVKTAVASVGKLRDASARHSSQELQLQAEAVSPGWSPSADMLSMLWTFMGQSSGMADACVEAASKPASVALLAELFVIKTCCIVISTAMASPTHPRRGSKAIMRTTSR